MVGIKGNSKKLSEEAENSDEEESENQGLAFDFSQSFEHMDWWPGLADLDRLNIFEFTEGRQSTIARIKIFQTS